MTDTWTRNGLVASQICEHCKAVHINASIGAEINRAAALLPYAWAIIINVEGGSASVYVENPSLEKSDHMEGDGLADEIRMAVDQAIARHADSSPAAEEDV